MSSAAVDDNSLAKGDTFEAHESSNQFDVAASTPESADGSSAAPPTLPGGGTAGGGQAREDGDTGDVSHIPQIDPQQSLLPRSASDPVTEETSGGPETDNVSSAASTGLLAQSKAENLSAESVQVAVRVRPLAVGRTDETSKRVVNVNPKGTQLALASGKHDLKCSYDW